jgi:hypothetical protein
MTSNSYIYIYTPYYFGVGIFLPRRFYMSKFLRSSANVDQKGRFYFVPETYGELITLASFESHQQIFVCLF